MHQRNTAVTIREQSIMRLTTEQINTTCCAVAGEGALVWLYGSRLDDTRTGV
ncbi:hypothetical protein [Pelodictyon phaeoclathratiforme]|uniref:hypothetical protein n=1 Tax=Pelodictyon phaeoclathratiforme TaxID=34090 RepID=UPI0002E15BDC|nr:hypothetical protein [Pelodictyon phaeoclathratiforme]MBV5288948.1 hypothetical protein [Pelodictyon phaeoclathratiforme]